MTNPVNAFYPVDLGLDLVLVAIALTASLYGISALAALPRLGW